MPQGKAGLRKGIAAALERTAERLPGIVIEALREQWQRITELDNQIIGIEHKLQVWLKTDKAAKALAAIPGVGLLTATAAVATMGCQRLQIGA